MLSNYSRLCLHTDTVLVLKFDFRLDALLTALDFMLDTRQSWDDTALLITRGLLQHFISLVLVALSNKICNNNLSFSWLCRKREELLAIGLQI